MQRPFSSPNFASHRLTIRSQSVDDAEALHEAYSDVGAMTYWSSAPHMTLSETRSYLAEREAPGEWRGWTITDRHSGRVLGTLAAHESKPHVAEIGYMVLRSHWGQGYAYEAVSRLIGLLFAEGYRRIWADTDPDNVPSNGLLKRLGFTCEGHLRGEWETHIGVRDSLIWGLLREEWRA